MRRISALLLALLIPTILFTETINYPDSWGQNGISLKTNSNKKVVLNYSISSFGIKPVSIDGSQMHELILSDVFLPNNEGVPNLPGISKFIAVPEGAKAKVKMVNFRTEIFKDIDMAPAPRIPWDTDPGELEYIKNEDIYNTDAFYPSVPVELSELTEIRGIHAVVLGITPFQYNPVSHELMVYRDIEIEVSFEGGSDQFGEDRLRSRWWDPIIRDMFINQASVPEMDYNNYYPVSKETGCEYLIITPNNPEFVSWADSIKQFRTLQGIITDVIKIEDVGGNTVDALEAFIDNIYYHWDIVPAAVLLLGDYGTNGDNSIISPIYDNYCASDNVLADVTGNNLPDIVFARITANNEQQLETMITKFLDYERNPPTSEDFYNHPVTALGWQTERWFQICAETVSGFWKNELAKEPVRVNEVFEGNPSTDPWSTAGNTTTVLNVFGPNGLGYIPASPSELGGWDGGNADDINNAINNGAFMLLHRDHGGEYGWGDPAYSNTDIDNLSNTDLAFVLSVNCLTGKYNIADECFAEKFHRYTSGGSNSGALGIIAASEVSYSFVNDTYVWGVFDHLWPDFLPQFGTAIDYRGVYPAFGSAAGKYFLHSSSWVGGNDAKKTTYNLFHHHGDAFLNVYTEVPEELTVIHNSVILENSSTFTVFADEGALIGLTVDGGIIATAEATFDPVDITIPPQSIGKQVIVTTTKQNFFRYSQMVEVISSNLAYVARKSIELNDENGNGQIDYGEDISMDVALENIGTLPALNVIATLSTENPFVSLTDNTEVFGDILAGGAMSVMEAFSFSVDQLIPDLEKIYFNIEASDGTDTWPIQCTFIAHAPVLEFLDFTIHDPSGNYNGRIDPGETVEIDITLVNNGSSDAYMVSGNLLADVTGLVVNPGILDYGTLESGVSVGKSFTVDADASVEEGTPVNFTVDIIGAAGISGQGSFMTVIGKYPALVLDLDPQNYSGPQIFNTFSNMDIFAEYSTTFPEDLDLYKNVFVCLGIKFFNYELSPIEGQLLKDYLLGGGNLYMEGRVTWADDLQTPVHSMFSIDVRDVSMFFISDIIGHHGSFAEGMQFGYDGFNAMNNYSIDPLSSAFGLFTTDDPSAGCMVAYDEGSYRTVGSTIEFGNLEDGSPPSTKAKLMARILDWFDGVTTEIEEQAFMSTQLNVISVQPNPLKDQTNIYFNLEEGSEFYFDIINLNGEKVRSFNKGFLQNNSRGIVWDAKDEAGNKVKPGIYFGVLRSDEKTQSVKLVITD